MKLVNLGLSAIALLLLTKIAYSAVPQDSGNDAALSNARTAVNSFCPVRSESVSQPIDTNVTAANIWANAADRTAFETAYTASRSPSAAELAAILNDAAAINAVCNTYRLTLLQLLINQNVADSGDSLEAANGVAEALDFASGRWEVGDVRVTGRSAPAAGWVFLNGKTIGSLASSADLKGPQYRDLYNEVKKWAPNTGTESWAANSKVKLPDMRGRSIYASKTMGGVTTPVAQSNVPVKVGTTFGNFRTSIGVNNMPSHTHSMSATPNHAHSTSSAGNHGHAMNNAGHHNHPMSNAGNHSHKMPKIREYLNISGGSGYTAPWLRHGADLSTSSAGNHKHALTAAGNHKHVITAAGNHAHTTNSVGSHAHTNAAAGGGQAVQTISPGIVFNVEMKY